MKKTVTLALTLALVLGLLSGCANNDTPADNAENSKAAETAENFTDEMKTPTLSTCPLRTARTPWNAAATMKTRPTSPTPTSTTWSPRTR